MGSCWCKISALCPIVREAEYTHLSTPLNKFLRSCIEEDLHSFSTVCIRASVKHLKIDKCYILAYICADGMIQVVGVEILQ